MLFLAQFATLPISIVESKGAIPAKKLGGIFIPLFTTTTGTIWLKLSPGFPAACYSKLAPGDMPVCCLRLYSYDRKSSIRHTISKERVK